MSFEFEPVRLTPRRRRVDSVVVGVAVVALALGIAVIKPWSLGATANPAPPTVGPAAAPVPGSTDPAGSPGLGDLPAASDVPAAPPLTWADLAPALDDHPTWGAAAILIAPSPLTGVPRYLENWSALQVGPDGPQSAYIGRDDQSIVALGLTFSADERPLDLRVWLVHSGDQLEWIDARSPSGPTPPDALLLVRPGTGGAAFSSWPGGHYRIDALVGGEVRRIAIQIPGRLGSVAQPEPWPPTATDLVSPQASDLSQVHAGLFATANGAGVALGAIAGPSLNESETWLQVVGQAGRPGARAVSTVYLPEATALGVMLPQGSTVRSALVRRLAPDPNFTTGLRFDGVSSSQRPGPYTLFQPRGGGAIPPGDYAFEVGWDDGTGVHDETWHVELRPGPN